MFHPASEAAAAPVDSPEAQGWSIPILWGPLRGRRWLAGSRGKLLRVLLGTYEREQTQLFQKYLARGDVLYDIGAAAGYYTLLAARLVGPEGCVLSFEPDPDNAARLRRHVKLNELPNVEVRQFAVAAAAGSARFGGGSGSGTGHLSHEGSYTVQVCRLDEAALDAKAPPTHLKIDVEGAELDVLRGGEAVLARYRPTIFLSTHGPEVHRACCEYLQSHEYRLTPIIGSSLETTTEVFARPQ